MIFGFKGRTGSGRPTAGPDQATAADSALVSTLNSQLDRGAAEIARRSTTQQTLQAGTLTAAAAVSAAVLDGLTPLALLLVPIVCVLLGFQWLDHHRAILEIGTYLRKEVERPLMARLQAGPTDPHLWETYMAKARRRQPRWTASWWKIPIMGVFYALAFVALALSARTAFGDLPATAPELPFLRIDYWPPALWILEFVTTCIGGFVMWRQLGQTAASENEE